MSFHAHNGLYFNRNPDGSVSIVKRETAKDGSPLIMEEQLNPDMWASVLSEMSVNENFGHQEALEFHG